MLHKTSHKGQGDEKASKSKEKLDGSQLDEDGIRDLSGDTIWQLELQLCWLFFDKSEYENQRKRTPLLFQGANQ